MFRALMQRLRRETHRDGLPGKRRRGKTDRRGVALVMVLGAITVLTVFLTELQGETSAELSAAMAERDALRAEYYARSAVNLSRLVIATESIVRQAIPIPGMPQVPVWNFTDVLLGPFNGQTALAAFGAASGLDVASGKNLGITGGGYFDVRIVDEESKTNLNMGAFLPQGRIDFARKLLSPGGLFSAEVNNPLFEGRDADDQFSDRATICAAIIDWTDDNEDLMTCDLSASAPSSTGVEDNFYQTIGLSYRRKNAPFDSVDELRLVRGMSRDDLWSKVVDPDPNDPAQRKFTPWGKKLNINSAEPLNLLAAVCANPVANSELCTDVEQQLKFMALVSMVRAVGIPIFSKPKEFINALAQKPAPARFSLLPDPGQMLKDLGISPVEARSPAELERSLSTKTRFLSIYAEGVVPGFHKQTRVRIHTVVDIDKAQGLSLPPPAGGTAPDTPPPDSRQDPGGNIIYWRME